MTRSGLSSGSPPRTTPGTWTRSRRSPSSSRTTRGATPCCARTMRSRSARSSRNGRRLPSRMRRPPPAERSDDPVKILAVCGMGLGSGLILRMQAEKALKELGIQADVEVADIGTARALASTADLILTSEELAQQLGTVKPRIVTIQNFIDLREMVTKLGGAIDRG